MSSARFGLLGALCLVGVSSVGATPVSPFISELHYDNTGADVGEFVAVTGPQGLDLSGWSLGLYNGSNGNVYRTLTLDGLLDAERDQFGELSWDVSLQNGPDAVALISALGDVIEFVAYESAFTANDGAAAGMTARLLPTSETPSTPVGMSLQRIGGQDEWDWRVAAATPGIVNDELRFAAPVASVAVPLPTAGLSLLAGLMAFGLSGRRRRL